MKKIGLIILMIFLLLNCESDNDTGPNADDPITVSFSTDSYSIVEGSFNSNEFIINLVVSGGVTTEDATVNITSNSNTTPDFYYQELPELTIPSGDYRSTMTVSYSFYVVNDCEIEPGESFVFKLENPSVEWLNIGAQDEITIVLEDDDVDLSDFLTGRIYDRTSLIIDTPVDLNNDGVFSYDIDLETNCTYPIIFLVHGNIFGECGAVVGCPLTEFPRIKVEYDANGDPLQTTACLIAGCDVSSYEINGNSIDIIYNNVVNMTGEFFENYSILTITYPSNYLFGANTYLLQDGTVAGHTGNAIATYELRE